MSNDGHCPYLHSWKIDSPETVDPIYQHWVPIVADWSIRPLYRGWYLLWLTIIDNGWQCNAFAGHLCRSFGSEKILELWVKIERFFKRAMVPFFCCNSATINAWSKSKCSACFIFVVTWLNFICWFTWQLRRLGESRLHCFNRSTLSAEDPCASLLLNFVYSTADNALHILMTDDYGYLPPKEEPQMFWLWKQCHRHRELAPNSLLLDLLLPTHFYHPWHHIDHDDDDQNKYKDDQNDYHDDHQTPHLPFSFLRTSTNTQSTWFGNQSASIAMYWKGLLFSERSTKSNEKDLAFRRHISRIVKECVVTSYIANILNLRKEKKFEETTDDFDDSDEEPIQFQVL